MTTKLKIGDFIVSTDSNGIVDYGVVIEPRAEDLLFGKMPAVSRDKVWARWKNGDWSLPQWEEPSEVKPVTDLQLLKKLNAEFAAFKLTGGG